MVTKQKNPFTHPTETVLSMVASNSTRNQRNCQGGYNSFMADAERLMSGTSAGAFELKSLSNLVSGVTQKTPSG